MAAAAITVGLYNHLRDDAALKALLPDGFWLEVVLPPPNGAPRTKFGLIAKIPVARDVPVFGGTAFEEHLYLVKAVTRDLSPQIANEAADRIAALLEDVNVAVPGYAWMTIHRIDPVELLLLDDADPKLTWQHRGGHYLAQYALL